MLSIIVCVSEDYGIGKDNQLLFHIADDLKRVKQITQGKTLIMGRKTFLSLPKTLPNRKHIVITTDKSFKVDDENVFIEHDLQNAMQPYLNSSDEAFIFGGESVYEQAMPFCRKLYVTRVLTKVDADTFFPKIDLAVWNITEQSEIMTDLKSGLNYIYVDYEKK